MALSPKMCKNIFFEKMDIRLFYSDATICLVGDFNFPDINWDSWMSPRIKESKESKFIDTVQSCYLHQHMHLPTIGVEMTTHSFRSSFY